jgi:hypothetical protein
MFQNQPPPTPSIVCYKRDMAGAFCRHSRVAAVRQFLTAPSRSTTGASRPRFIVSFAGGQLQGSGGSGAAGHSILGAQVQTDSTQLSMNRLPGSRTCKRCKR